MYSRGVLDDAIYVLGITIVYGWRAVARIIVFFFLKESDYMQAVYENDADVLKGKFVVLIGEMKKCC